LAEIAACGSRRGPGESDEAVLVRLGADPLLLYDHLKNASDASRRVAGPPGGLNQRFLPSILFIGAVPSTAGTVGDCNYSSVNSGEENSIRPRPFIATGEDKALSLAIDPSSGRLAEEPSAGANAGSVSILEPVGLCWFLAICAIAGVTAVFSL
jgi:hypothetical protein